MKINNAWEYGTDPFAPTHHGAEKEMWDYIGSKLTGPVSVAYNNDRAFDRAIELTHDLMFRWTLRNSDFGRMAEVVESFEIL